jgi:hypothetical protein
MGKGGGGEREREKFGRMGPCHDDFYHTQSRDERRYSHGRLFITVFKNETHI